MSGPKCNPYPADAVEIDAPPDIVSLLPFMISCFGSDMKTFFRVPSSCRMESKSSKGSSTEVWKVNDTSFPITFQPPHDTLNDEALTFLAEIPDKDIIVPFGTAQFVSAVHTGHIFMVPPRGERTFLNDRGNPVGCMGLIWVRKAPEDAMSLLDDTLAITWGKKKSGFASASMDTSDSE